MRSFSALCVVNSFARTNSARIGIDQLILYTAEQPAVRADLPECPCTIWRQCDHRDVLPEDGGDGTGDGLGVACVASEDSVISMGHQVQCVPPRHGGLNYYCPPELSVKCDPGAPCRETELSSCQESDCERPDWLPKQAHAAFCAMEQCTHAECCDRGPMTITDAPEAAPEPPTSCDEKVNALAEATLARLVAYQSECQFNAGDVQFGGQVEFDNGQFDLTDGGQAKLWAEHCQHVPALQNSPDDVYADAQALQAECPDHARLNAQLNSMGIFGTTQVLDHFWRACRDAGMTTCAPEQAPAPAPASSPTIPSQPSPAAPTPTEAPDSCVGTFTFTVQLSSGSQQYEQSLTLGSAPEGAMRHLQCNAGPMVHGSFNMVCRGGTWALTNHGNPCYDNEEDARQAEERDRAAGGYVDIPTTTFFDVTALVTRMQDDEHSPVKCCCDARLDASLWANLLVHRRWNAREHTGICTLYDTGETCSHTGTGTHSHDRTEGHRCIVNDADRSDWERILRLDRPAGPRFATPNVPTVSSQDAEAYENCVPEHSIGQCERCTHSEQCAEDHFCCPHMKLCVKGATTQCEANRVAGCSNCFERFTPNPEHCHRCENPNFPRKWLPECHSGRWFR